MTNKRPSDYAQGWGELIRAHRNFIGISQRALAYRMKLSERSLSDIEVGRRSCPPGFLDAVETVADEFDNDVEKVIEVAQGCTDEMFTIKVDPDPKNEWQRAVVGRAAVESGKIMPVMEHDNR